MAKNIAASRQKKPGGLSDKVSDIVLVVICAAVMLIVAYPLYYVLVASFSDPYDVYAGKTFLLPSQFTLKGYQAVFADSALFSGFMNSIKYTVIGTIYSVVMIYLVAYPLSVKDLPGRKYISLFFVITMYFGGGLVPTYLIVKQTGLLGSMWALFLPGVVAVGNVIIVRNFFENNIPRELLEAAEIDGASKWTVFVKDGHPSEPFHYGRYGGVQHGGLLERLVHRSDLPESRSGSAAAGVAQYPDQELHQRQPVLYGSGRLCRTE